MRPLVVLGATGSIGRQTLDVARRLGLDVVAVAARTVSEGVLALADEFGGARVGFAGPTPSEKQAMQERLGDRAVFGSGGIADLAASPGTTVVNGIVGVAGLPSSVAALEAGNRLALANKESLVAGGEVVLAARDAGGGELVPVDSEHSALHQCLVGEDPGSIRRIVLSASGGPFRGRSAEEVAAVTVEEALQHPTWDMGPRITIDSATLMNKAFEVIEAHHLFGIDYDRIDVVVHPQSIVHSLIEFVDGSLKAHLGEPDMRVPIQYAITAPDRSEGVLGSFDLTDRALTFERPDRTVFRCLDLGYAAGRAGGSAPAVLNAADEVAVQAFLEKRIGLSSIPEVVERTLDAIALSAPSSVEEVLEVDREARNVARSLMGGMC